MLCFMAGFILPLVAVLVWALTHDVSGIWWQARPDPAHAAAMLVGLPVVTAWICLELVDRVRPRRAFDGRSKACLARTLCGCTASIASAVLATLTVVAFEERVPDEVVIAGSTMLATLSCVLMMKRKKRGHCVLCGYDLRASQQTAICPECGGLATMG